MIDLRYHIATVVALFLALGIGIFIGSTFISDNVFLREQEQLITLLEQDFENLRSENRYLRASIDELQNSINEYNNLGEEIFPVLSQQRLNGKKIGLISLNPGYPLENFQNAFDNTGVDFIFHINVIEAFNSKTKEIDKFVKSFLDMVENFLVTNSNDEINEIDSSLKDLVEIRVKEKCLADHIIVFSSNIEENTFIDILEYNLINLILKKNISVIGVGISNLNLLANKKSDIPIINNIDDILGKMKLLRLLEEDYY